MFVGLCVSSFPQVYGKGVQLIVPDAGYVLKTREVRTTLGPQTRHAVHSYAARLCASPCNQSMFPTPLPSMTHVLHCPPPHTVTLSSTHHQVGAECEQCCV